MTSHSSDAGRQGAEGGSMAEAAEQRLHASPYLALKTIHCEYRDGVLTLLGQLPSYYLKQMAQALFTNVEGIQRIDNRIEVVAPVGLMRPQSGEERADGHLPHLGTPTNA